MTRDEDYAAYASARWVPLVRAAVLLGCPRHEAEDLVQRVLIRCFLSWDKVMKATDRDAFVYRMLVNAQATSRRRRWWGERPSDRLADSSDGTDPIESADLSDSVRRALHDLGRDARTVVVLRYYGDLTKHQTAEVLGIPVGTVKSRVSRALAQLADNPRLADLSEGGTR